MNDLKHISPDKWLGDEDMEALQRLLEMRGGCRCHLAPPCRACTDPPTEEELNAVGFTYEEN